MMKTLNSPTRDLDTGSSQGAPHGAPHTAPALAGTHDETFEVLSMLKIVKRVYTLTVTDEPDEDFLKYLRRKLNLKASAPRVVPPSALRLDISLDDEEGDVVAGLAAMTAHGCLNIELLWVDQSLRGDGIGARLLGAAEELARARGCTRVRVTTAQGAAYFTARGFSLTGRLRSFPEGVELFALEKALVSEAAQKDSA
jgi:GNAT superfamily N-acetyltransferase